MTDWQPIETAPKVGPKEGVREMVFLASTSGHRAVGYWGGGRNQRDGGVNPHDHLVMDY